jgi:regulator of G-protein signaling
VEGRTLPDSQQVPSSPASKHSISSDHSSVSTPKKVLRLALATCVTR